MNLMPPELPVRETTIRNRVYLALLFTAAAAILGFSVPFFMIPHLPPALQGPMLPFLLALTGLSLFVAFRRPVVFLYALFVWAPLDTFMSRLLLVTGITDKGTLVKDALVLLILFALIYRFFGDLLARGTIVVLQGPDLFLVMLGPLLVLQTLRSPYVPAGLFGLRGLVWFGVIFVFIRQRFTAQSIRKLLKLSLITSVFVGAYGLFQVLIGSSAFTSLGYEPGDVAFRTTGGLLRAISTTDSAATLAAYAMIWICVAAGLFTYESDRMRKRLLVLIGLLGLALILTSIRAAWFSCAFGLFCAWLINRRVQRLSVYVFILALILLIIINLATQNFLLQRLLSSLGLGGHQQSLESNVAHLRNFAQGVEIFLRYPLLGSGLGTTGIASIKYAEFLGSAVGVDSFYIKMLAETGVVGTTLYLAFYSALVWKAYRVYRYMPRKRQKGLALGTFVALLALGMMNFVHSILESPLVSLTFWFLAGLILVLARDIDEAVAGGDKVLLRGRRERRALQ